MVYIYCIDVSTIDYVAYESFLKVVSEERRQKSLAYYRHEDAKRSVCSEMLLRYCLHQVYNRSEKLDIRYNAYGKPYLCHLPDFHYNVSHSGDWVFLACSSKELGIDIEKMQAPEDGLVEQFFSKRDVDYILNAPPDKKAKRFIETWTLKESYIKYLGTGLSTSMDSFFIDCQSNRVHSLAQGTTEELCLESFLWQKDYWVAICSLEREYHIEKVSVEQLLSKGAVAL